jgi:hypothetical protein
MQSNLKGTVMPLNNPTVVNWQELAKAFRFLSKNSPLKDKSSDGNLTVRYLNDRMYDEDNGTVTQVEFSGYAMPLMNRNHQLAPDYDELDLFIRACRVVARNVRIINFLRREDKLPPIEFPEILKESPDEEEYNKNLLIKYVEEERGV